MLGHGQPVEAWLSSITCAVNRLSVRISSGQELLTSRLDRRGILARPGELDLSRRRIWIPKTRPPMHPTVRPAGCSTTRGRFGTSSCSLTATAIILTADPSRRWRVFLGQCDGRLHGRVRLAKSIHRVARAGARSILASRSGPSPKISSLCLHCGQLLSYAGFRVFRRLFFALISHPTKIFGAMLRRMRYEDRLRRDGG